MQDLSIGQGRTVLFVSHNMASVSSLCTKGIVLVNGSVKYSGEIDECVDYYLNDNTFQGNNSYLNISKIEKSDILEIQVLKEGKSSSNFRFDEKICLNFKIYHHYKDKNVFLSFTVIDQKKIKIFSSEIELENISSGHFKKDFKVEIPKAVLVPNNYTITVALHIPNIRFIKFLESIVSFGIEETGSDFAKYGKSDIGCIFLPCKWVEIN